MILIYYISNLLRMSNYIPSFIHKYGTIINSKDFINYIFSDDVEINSSYFIKYGKISLKIFILNILKEMNMYLEI